MTDHQQVLPCKVYDHQSLEHYREVELETENKQTNKQTTRKMAKKTLEIFS